MVIISLVVISYGKKKHGYMFPSLILVLSFFSEKELSMELPTKDEFSVKTIRSSMKERTEMPKGLQHVQNWARKVKKVGRFCLLLECSRNQRGVGFSQMLPML